MSWLDDDGLGRDPAEDDDRMREWAEQWQYAYDRLCSLGVLDERDDYRNTTLPEMQQMLALIGETAEDPL